MAAASCPRPTPWSRRVTRCSWCSTLGWRRTSRPSSSATPPTGVADRSVDGLIVGAGAAGSACAEALAEGGFDGSVLLVGRESDPPYERPPASKGYLRGDVGRDATYLRPAGFWERSGVELRTRVSAMKLDTEAREAQLSSKERVAFGQAVLATGANVRRLRVPGAQLEGIHYLRALGNADTIRE